MPGSRRRGGDGEQAADGEHAHPDRQPAPVARLPRGRARHHRSAASPRTGCRRPAGASRSATRSATAWPRCAPAGLSRACRPGSVPQPGRRTRPARRIAPGEARCCRRTGCRRRPPSCPAVGRRCRTVTAAESPALGDGDGDEGRPRGRGDARCRLAVLALPGERDVAPVRDLQRADAGAGVGPGAGLPVGPPQRPVRAGRRDVDAGVARGRPRDPAHEAGLALHVGQRRTRSPGTPSRRPCRHRRRRTPAAPRRRAGGGPPPRSRRCCPSSPPRRPGPGTGAPVPRPPARARRPRRIPRGIGSPDAGGWSSRCGSTGTDR